MAAPFTAPRTVLNTGFTAQRNIAFARLDLRDIKAVKDHFGVKVNDVVMALVSGVVRQFMQDRAELPGKSLVAMQPVSVHGLSESTARNQVSGMLVHLQTDIADPVERLKAVAEANRIAKEQVSAISPTLLEDFGETVGAVLLGIAKRVYARLTKFRPMYNVILSNVPGPDSGRYFLGAEIKAAYPFGPILLGAGLNFTLWSMNGYFTWADLVPKSDPQPVRSGRGCHRWTGRVRGRDRRGTNSFRRDLTSTTPSPTRTSKAHRPAACGSPRHSARVPVRGCDS